MKRLSRSRAELNLDVSFITAVESMGTCMCLSTGSNYSMEEVADAAPNALKWFQLYVNK